MTHICISKLTIIGSDNGLSLGRCQAIIRTNAGILLIRPLGTNLSEILIEILIFSFKKMRLKVSSAKRRPFCPGLNVLTKCIRQCCLPNKCWPFNSSLNVLTHLVLEHSQQIRSRPLLLMPWLLTSPDHQQPCYWLYIIKKVLAFHVKLFQPPSPSQCQEIIETANTSFSYMTGREYRREYNRYLTC